MTGEQLMCGGIKITLQDDFAAAIFHYAPAAQ